MEFIRVDVVTDPGGLDRLLRLGVRSVPVVTRGDDYVFAQNLEDVARFLHLDGSGHSPLPPAELVQKWINVLRASQRLILQIPAERMNDRVIVSRDRSLRVVGHHVFRIAEAFLESVVHGVDYSVGFANVSPGDGAYTTPEEVAGYGEQVIEQLQQWWHNLADRSCREQVPTYYGVQSVWELLERSTWHSAHHVRQIAHALARYDIEPDGPLTSADLAGLPLPDEFVE